MLGSMKQKILNQDLIFNHNCIISTSVIINTIICYI